MLLSEGLFSKALELCSAVLCRLRFEPSPRTIRIRMAICFLLLLSARVCEFWLLLLNYGYFFLCQNAASRGFAAWGERGGTRCRGCKPTTHQGHCSIPNLPKPSLIPQQNTADVTEKAPPSPPLPRSGAPAAKLFSSLPTIPCTAYAASKARGPFGKLTCQIYT